VGDEPFGAVVVVPELGAGHEEEAPAVEPGFGVGLAVGIGEEVEDEVFVGVGVGEPGFGGLGVVGAAQLPVVVEGEVVLQVEGEVVGGHHAAGEEVAGHPVGVGFGDEVVGESAVGEDVHEEEAGGGKPGGDSAEEFGPVFHVLEHLDGDDAVEACGWWLKHVHVGGEDGEVGNALGGGLFFDVLTLGGGVGDGGDVRAGEALGEVEGEGAPAATEFEDALAVGEVGAGLVEAEHGEFGVFEGADAWGVEGAGVFEAWAEAFLVEGGGDLVVLGVGVGGVDGDGCGAEPGEEGAETLGDGVGAASGLVGEALGELATDAEAERGVGEEASVEEGIEHGGRVGIGD
jgi:hypothetical protein